MNYELINKSLKAFPKNLPSESDSAYEENKELNRILQGRDPLDIPKEIGMNLCLLSKEELLYFCPGLIKLTLSEESDCGNSFIDILATPISKKNPPSYHPTLGALTKEQTSIISDFLEELTKQEEADKVLERAIKNWKLYLKNT